MKITTYMLLLLACSACQYAADDSVTLIDSLPTEPTAYQQTIVGQLSGEYALADQTYIKSRWTKEERIRSRAYLKQLLQTLDIEPLEQAYTWANLNPAIDMLLGPYRGTNIYGILPATTSDAGYLIMGAHYDTGKRHAPGAIDNATGIALIYQVAKSMSRLKERNKHLVIVFFDQEEEELIGSKAFIELINDQQWSVHSAHCFDMIGWDGDGDNAMSMYSASASLREHYRKVAKNMNKPLLETVIKLENYTANSTDHDAFIHGGFNAIGLGDCVYQRDYSPYKDSPDDTYDTVNFAHLQSCTEFVEAAIKELITR